MGLDMFARAKVLHIEPADTPQAQQAAFIAAIESQGAGHSDELHYWRKHHDLHGWMEKLYHEKGGTETFNCVPVLLTAEDLDKLEADVKAGQLLHIEGFLFGNNPPNDESVVQDLSFIEKARKALADGKTVFYDSWW